MRLRLSKGYWAVVDDDCGADLMKWSAFVSGQNVKRVYAVRNESGRTVYLHRWLMGFPDGMDIDHINGDTLDNRLINLRACSRRENLANNRRARGGVGFRGVTFEPDRARPYRCRVSQKYIGHYATAEEAAHAYDEHAIKEYGVFAKTNFYI